MLGWQRLRALSPTARRLDRRKKSEWGLDIGGRAQESIQLQKSMGGTWPRQLRWITGQGQDLARTCTSERVSEAGPRRPSQGTSGGPEVSSLAPARDEAEGIHRWKALRAWETAALVCCLWKGSSVLLFQLANQRASEEKRDRKRPWPHRPARATVENTGARVNASQSKGEAAPGKTRRGEDESRALGRTEKSHCWRTRRQLRRHLGSEMPSGYPAPNRRTQSELSTSVLGEGWVPKGRSARWEPRARE